MGCSCCSQLILLKYIKSLRLVTDWSAVSTKMSYNTQTMKYMTYYFKMATICKNTWHVIIYLWWYHTDICYSPMKIEHSSHWNFWQFLLGFPPTSTFFITFQISLPCSLLMIIAAIGFVPECSSQEITSCLSQVNSWKTISRKIQQWTFREGCF